MELLEIFFKYLSSFSKKLSKDFDVIILNLLRRVFMNKRGQEVKYICQEDLRKLRKYFKLNDKVVILALINIGVNVGLRISDLV